MGCEGENGLLITAPLGIAIGDARGAAASYLHLRSLAAKPPYLRSPYAEE